jgi:hypothetical protein
MLNFNSEELRIIPRIHRFRKGVRQDTEGKSMGMLRKKG